MNGWLTKLIASTAVLAVIMALGGNAMQTYRLGEITARLGVRVEALTKEMVRIGATNARLDALERRAIAWERRR